MMNKFLLLLCVGLLVACGAPTKPPTQVLPPHMVNIKGEAFDGAAPNTMKVGEFYVFTGDSKGWIVSTSTPELVQIEQGGTKDTYETNPGFSALKAGNAIVTVTSPANTVFTLTITIE